MSAPPGDAALLAAAQRMLDEGAVLDAFYDHLRSLGDLHVEYDLLDVERDGSHTFVLYDDPERRHRSYSPRCFAVTRREDGGFYFEEV